MPLLDAIPPIRGRVGHPRRKPASLFAYRDARHPRGQPRHSLTAAPGADELSARARWEGCIGNLGIPLTG
jgi:hypothetical protein